MWGRIKSIFITYRYPLIVSISLRIGFSLWMMILWYFLEPIASNTPKFVTETYQNLTPQTTWLGRALIDVWLRWDAVHYMNLARIGYAGVGVADYNYPPLYSYLTLWLKDFFYASETIVGLTISTITAILAFCFFYKLVWNEFNDEKLAKTTILLFGIYPTILFLYAPFTEGLFFCILFGFFLACQSQKWLLAGFLAALASLIRFQAILLCIPILMAVWSQYRINRQVDWRKLCALILAPMGLIGFYAWRYFQNAPDLFQGYALHSGSVFMDPFRGYYFAMRQAILSPEWLPKTEVLSTTIFGAILIWMVFQSKFKSRMDWLVYSLVTLAIFMSKNNAYSAYQSANRYVLSLFPVFIAGAGWFLTLRPKLKSAYILISLAVMLFVCTLYAMWIFVG
jgi:hypothetical protein